MNIESIKNKIRSYSDEVYYGLAARKDIFWLLVSGFFGIVMHCKPALQAYYRCCLKRIERYYNQKLGIYDFNGIILPSPAALIDRYLLSRTYSDQIHIHCRYKDIYRKIDFDRYSRAASEGPICFPIYKSAVTVKQGEVVIDCGAWIGDFSAYAAYHGAVVYAFEPLSSNFKMLKKTAKYAESLSGRIIPVQAAVSDKNGQADFSSQHTGSSLKDSGRNHTDETVRVISIDSYVEDNHISCVDFIKADIEGAERDMLKGAVNTLRNFAPKLSICTYHLPDDPVVLEKLILSANPDYVIIQKPKKLYAYVPAEEDKKHG